MQELGIISVPTAPEQSEEVFEDMPYVDHEQEVATGSSEKTPDEMPYVEYKP